MKMRCYIKNNCRVLMLAAISLAPSQMQGEIIGYEPFSYVNGETLAGADGGAFWDYKNTAPAGHTTRASEWRNAPGFSGSGTLLLNSGELFTNEVGLLRNYSGSLPADETAGAVNGDSPAKKVYYRISMTRGGAAWCGLSSFDFGAERLFFGLYPDGTDKFSIYDQTTFSLLIRSGVTVNPSQTYTLVAKLDFANDVVSLYVDPDLAQSEGSSTPVATAAYTGSNWSTAVRVASNGLSKWDDLTVATTWESLRTHQVRNSSDTGAGSLRQAVADASVSGARVTFSPFFGSLYAVADPNRLIRFHPDTPGTLDLNVPITGLASGEKVVALDFRLAGWDFRRLQPIELFALAVRDLPTATEGRLYRLDSTTGAATAVGPAPAFTANRVLGGSGYGFDYEPFEDHFRIVYGADVNVTIDAESGGVVADTPLTLPAGSSGDSHPQAIASMAFDTYAYALYGLRNDNSLVRIPLSEVDGTPNFAGSTVIGSVGPLGEFSAAGGGFDIGETWEFTRKVAYLAARMSATNAYHLRTVDLSNGKSVDQGRIGSGPLVVRGLTAAPRLIQIGDERQISISSGKGVIVDGASAKGKIRLAPYWRGHLNSRVFDVAAGSALSLSGMTMEMGSTDEGGVIRSNGSLSLDQCTFQYSAATAGGAVSAVAGTLKVKRCTFGGCLSTTAGGAIDIGSANAVITHSTFTGNRIDGPAGSSSSGGGAIANAAGTLTLTACLLAENTASTGVGPDIWNSSVITATDCVIGVGTNSGLTASAANGNAVGTGASPVPARLAPTGDYGGPTPTRPPLPGSSALERGRTSNIAGDQRGLAIQGFPDAGAAEFRGKSDLDRWWTADWDGDGIPYGQELLAGSDPFTRNRTDFALQEAASGPARFVLAVGSLNPTFFKHAKFNVVAGSSPDNFNLVLGEGVPSGGGFALNGSGGFLWGNPTPGTHGLYFNIGSTTPRMFFRLEAITLP